VDGALKKGPWHLGYVLYLVLTRRLENTGLSIHSISTQKNKWSAGSCRQVLYCAVSYIGRQLVSFLALRTTETLYVHNSLIIA